MKFKNMIKEYEALKIKEKELEDALKEPASNVVLQSLNASLKEVEENIKNYEEIDFIKIDEVIPALKTL